MITEEIRSYEVSIWTLLDEFITVLKWSDIEQKGRIENPKMTLNIDGTLNFEFSIPMCYYSKGKLIDNPNWYNTLNGNLIEGMRKIKVIFNHDKNAIYEFLVVNTEEVHEKDMPICNVKCEGLAFHELGKKGYKISLSLENFELKYKEWAEGDKSAPEPIESLDYWCNDESTCNLPKRPENENEIDPNIWYYTVTMNHKSFKNDLGARATNKIYETPYATSWSLDLTPGNFEYYREKARPISVDKSNLYNITLTIAEAFEVHCTYKYTYDDNYHITSRTIVFYNHFFLEEEGTMSFTYPYSSSKITRTKESNNLTTKLFVLTADNENTVSGYNTIMNAVSNASKEDYILNFDYMHERKIITDDLYNGIKPYELKMREYNKNLILLLLNLSTYELLKIDLEALIQVHKKSIELDLENITLAQSLRNSLDIKDGDADGYITIDNNNPDLRIISLEIKTGKYYINLTTTNKGIILETIKIYRDYNTTTHVLDTQTQITSGFSYHYDDYGRIDRIYGIEPTLNSSKVYLTYKYNPELYYDAIFKTWSSKLGADKINYEKELKRLGPESITDEDYDLATVYKYYANNTFDTATSSDKTDAMIAAYNAGLNKKIKDTKDSIEDYLGQLRAARLEFEYLMGPALREGYWQPENYLDYGNHLNETKQLSVNTDITADSGESFIVGWDTELFDDEDKNYYEESVNLTPIYYPCIDLSYTINGQTIYDMIKENIMNYSFISNNNYLDQDEVDANDVRYTLIFSIGSQALLLFGKKGNTIYPLLVLVGAKTLTDDEIAFMKRNTTTVNNVTTKGGNPRLGIIESHENGAYSITANNPSPINVAAAFVDGGLYTTVYPRIKFSSLNLRANSSDFIIYYNNNDIEIAKDYIILTRDTFRDNNYYPEYYITIFPASIYKGLALNGNFEVHYVISNADNQIYLDALEVSKENAYPKVEYTVDPTILNHNLSRTLYSKLATLVMINDVDLKLEDVFGYISLIELDLDNVNNDTVEVKNYKTKFEDLFSTIVAQTEDMKRDGIAVHAASEGKISLTSDALTKSLIDNNITMYAYLDSYFDSSDVVKEKLESLFTEASEILGDSGKSLNQMRALSLENAEILSGFAQNVSKELAIKVVKSSTKPTDYKPGDIWIDDEGNRYVATSYSNEGQAGGTSGYVRTHDGTLASMTGTALDINADDGEIKLTAANNLYLASNLVDIVGNDVVNIGGATVNIVSLTKDDTTYNAGGINLVAAAYSANIELAEAAKVLIHPDKITMAGSLIEMYTGTTANSTSAIKLDGTVDSSNPTPGIWLGSEKSILLFSGTNSTGSNVLLTPTHIIMGVSSGNDTSAFEIQKDFLVMATGTTGSDFSSSNITLNAGATGSLTGMKLTKDSFGLAIGSGSSRTVILANSNGITLGTGATPITDAAAQTGSYVNISGNGVEIGSLGKLYVNMDNFKLQTDSTNGTRFAVGSGFNSVNPATLNSTSNFVGLVYNKNGLFINGKIYAIEFVSHCEAGEFRANSSNLGFYTTSGTAIFYMSSTGALTAAENLTISSGKTLTMSGANISLTANDSKFIINSSTPKLYIANHKTWSSATSGISYTSSGLAVKGDITATSFTLSGTTASSEFKSAIENSGVEFGTNGLTFNNSRLNKTGGSAVGTVELTSAAGALVLGANKGIYVIKNNNSNLDDTYLAIDKTKIYLDMDSGNYIHLSNSGIAVGGSSITIDGLPLWGRNDIIYSVEEPTTHPAHDWIWILPNSNAEAVSSWTGSISMSYGGNTTLWGNFTTGRQSANLSGNNFKITVSITATFNDANVQWHYSFTPRFSIQVSNSVTGASVGNTESSTGDDVFIAVGDTQDRKTGATFYAYTTKATTTNVSSDNSALVVRLKNLCNEYVTIKLINVSVTTTGATSRVPCDVYYYP